MALAEHDNVVKAFPSDRTDQPFGTSILPRGAWRRWSVANAHRSKSSDENFAIRSIAIADQIAGKLLPSAGFRYLVCDPFRGRMRGDSEPYDLSSAMSDLAWVVNDAARAAARAKKDAIDGLDLASAFERLNKES